MRLSSKSSSVAASSSLHSQSEDGGPGSWLWRHVYDPLPRCLLLAAIWGIVGFWFLRERMRPLDRMYFLAQTLTTVGYGDLPGPADTDSGYLFFAFYALLSTLLIGQLLGVLIGRVTVERDMQRSTRGAALGCVGSMDARLVKFLKALFVWCMFVVTWAIFFSFYPGEDKHPVEGVYMAVVTLTTIGFGDSVPETDGGKIFATVWMVAGTYAFTDLMGKFAIWTYFFFNGLRLKKLNKKTLQWMTTHHHFQRVSDARAKEIQKLLGGHAAEHIHAEFSRKISRNDFVVFSLIEMGLVDEDMVELLSVDFDELDVSGDGYIERSDLTPLSE